jgi:hypothetical protein
MRLSSPSLIKIEDGEYARGKRIQVLRRVEVMKEMKSVLEALRFLEKTQKPGDRLVFGCIASQIEGNEMLYCGTFLERY